MSYEADNQEDLLKEFYDECYKLLDKQVFPLKDKKQQLCAIQAVRHFLRDIERTHGKWVVLRIIKASGESHDLKKNSPLSQDKSYESQVNLEWFGEDLG